MTTPIKNRPSLPVQSPSVQTGSSRGAAETSAPAVPHETKPLMLKGSAPAGVASPVEGPKDSFAVKGERTEGPVLKPQAPPKTQSAGPVASAQAAAAVDGHLTPERAAAVTSFVTKQQGVLLGQMAQAVKSGKVSAETMGPMMEQGLKLAQATESASKNGQLSMADTEKLSGMLAQHFSQTTQALPNAGGFSFSLFGKNKPSEAQTALAQQMSHLSQEVTQGRAGNQQLMEFFKAQSAAPAASAAAAPPSSAPQAQAPAASSSSMLQQMGGLLSKVAGSVLKQVADSFPVPTEQLTSNLKEQSAALSTKVSEGVQSGKLSKGQGEALLKDLQAVDHSLSEVATKGQVPMSEVLGLLKQGAENIAKVSKAFDGSTPLSAH